MTTVTSTSAETLSAHDKSILSRATILRWYRAKKLEKLRMLKNEIARLSSAKRKVLRSRIIANTKLELAQYKKHLTPAQRQLRAETFVNDLFKVARTGKSFEKFVKKYETIGKSSEASKLYEYWLGNDQPVVGESTRYLVMLDFKKSFIKKEAFLLLGLIEKYWSKEDALRVYKSCWGEGVFSLQPMWKFFSKKKAGSKLGFYYGTRKIRIYKGGYIVNETIGRIWKSRMYKTFPVTGWWTVDEDETENNNIKGDTYAPIKYLARAKKELQGAGYGDEYTGSQFLHKSLSKIRQEYRTGNDSGLNRDEEQVVLKSLSGLKREFESLSNIKVKRKILNWFKKQPKNAWLSPSQDIINLLSFVYGAGTGNYIYRYAPDKKLIYILPLQKAHVEAKYFGGYLKVKNGMVGKTWNAGDVTSTKKFMISYIKAMDEKDIKKEIIDNRLRQENSEDISYDVKLARTTGMVAVLSGVPKYVYYHELSNKYFDLIEKKLKTLLIKRKLPKARAEELARIRVNYMRNNINHIIDGDELLHNAIDEHDKVKLSIAIDDKDKVEISLAENSWKKKWLKARRKLEDAEVSLGSVKASAYEKLEKRVEKLFGPAAPFAMWILNEFFKVKDSISKLFSGKTSPFAGLISGFLGISFSKELIGSRKINQARFDKLLKSKRRLYRAKRKLFFNEDVKLKGKKIIIPQGKGILLGKSMPLYLKGKGKFRAYPSKKQTDISLKTIFGRVGKGNYMYKDSKIIIENGTVIPKGTIIPKGARIKRIN